MDNAEHNAEHNVRHVTQHVARPTAPPPPAVPVDALLALPAELTIYTAAELHPQWLQWLNTLTADSGPAAVRAGAVDQVDAAGLQMLLSLAHAMSEREQVLRLHEPSGPLQQACEALGLQDWLRAHTQMLPDASPRAGLARGTA